MSSVTQQGAYHHGNLRNALLESAAQLLGTHGAAAISLREVARHAGVSHAAPYRHFKGKSALLLALAESGFERLCAQIRASAVEIPHDPQQKLLAAARAYAELAGQNPELLRLMFAEAAAPAASGKPETGAQAVFELLVEIMRSGIEAGVFRDRKPRELALAAWTMMHGLAVLCAGGQLAMHEDPAGAPDELAAVLVQNLLYGITR